MKYKFSAECHSLGVVWGKGAIYVRLSVRFFAKFVKVTLCVLLTEEVECSYSTFDFEHCTFFASKTPLQLIASPVSYWAPTLSFSIVARGGACVLVFPAQLERSVPVGLDSFYFFLGRNLQGF